MEKKITLVKMEDRYDLYCNVNEKLASSAPNPFGKLSKQNCDELFDIVDVEKLAIENCTTWENFAVAQGGFIKGFNKKAELDKDKVFTDKDMIEFAKWVFLEVGQNKNLDRSNEELLKEWKSLQNEIKVEIVMEDVTLSNTRQNTGNYLLGELLKQTVFPNPKLDENGCLILIKKT